MKNIRVAFILVGLLSTFSLHADVISDDLALRLSDIGNSTSIAIGQIESKNGEIDDMIIILRAVGPDIERETDENTTRAIQLIKTEIRASMNGNDYLEVYFAPVSWSQFGHFDRLNETSFSALVIDALPIRYNRNSDFHDEETFKINAVSAQGYVGEMFTESIGLYLSVKADLLGYMRSKYSDVDGEDLSTEGFNIINFGGEMGVILKTFGIKHILSAGVTGDIGIRGWGKSFEEEVINLRYEMQINEDVSLVIQRIEENVDFSDLYDDDRDVTVEHDRVEAFIKYSF